MKGILKYMAIVVFVLFLGVFAGMEAEASPIAHLDWVNEVGVDGQSGRVQIGAYDTTVQAGIYTVDLNFEAGFDAYDGLYYGYCIEDEPSASNSNYDFYVAEGSFDRYEAAAYLFNQYGSSVSTQAQKAGLQLAIWEAVLDYQNYNLAQGQGNFYVYNGHFADALPAATTYLGSLVSFNPTTFDASAYGLVSDDNPLNEGPTPDQDYIVRNPIPEPATMFLLGGGLFGLAFAGKRRKLV